MRRIKGVENVLPFDENKVYTFRDVSKSWRVVSHYQRKGQYTDHDHFVLAMCSRRGKTEEKFVDDLTIFNVFSQEEYEISQEKASNISQDRVQYYENKRIEDMKTIYSVLRNSNKPLSVYTLGIVTGFSHGPLVKLLSRMEEEGAVVKVLHAKSYVWSIKGEQH